VWLTARKLSVLANAVVGQDSFWRLFPRLQAGALDRAKI